MAFSLSKRFIVAAAPLRSTLSSLYLRHDYRFLQTAVPTQGTRNISRTSGSKQTDPNQDSKQKTEKKKERRRKLKRAAWILGGGLCITAAVPVAVGALGFGSAGIAAGSVAAAMQSASAGTVCAGAVSTLQSIGAAGLTFSQGALITTYGSAATYYGSAGIKKGKKVMDKFSFWKKNKNSVDDTKENEKEEDTINKKKE